MAAALTRRPQPDEAQARSLVALAGRVILIGGPIASGKTTISNLAAAELRDRGVSTAVVDVDVIYEMLEVRGPSAGSPEVWARATRLARRIAAELVEDGLAVVFVEGDFLDPDVVLWASADDAVRRVGNDPRRGISRDERFLRRHYAEIAPRLAQLPPETFVLDTTELEPDEAGRRLAMFATTRRDREA